MIGGKDMTSEYYWSYADAVNIDNSLFAFTIFTFLFCFIIPTFREHVHFGIYLIYSIYPTCHTFSICQYNCKIHCTPAWKCQSNS